MWRLLLLAIFIPEDKISEIKNAVDIVDIISDTVLLKKTGRNFVGLCPFHSEKTPSFTVSPEKQIYHCFGCGSGGNAFSFLMNQEGLSFPDAARTLAKRYGVNIPTQTLTPEQRRAISQKENLLHINKQAMDYFQQSLTTAVAGKRARSYLKQRGFSGDIIERFNLGYAPAGWDNLIRFFSKKRISGKLLETAGLVVARKDQRGGYDRFRDRIIFPIIDTNMKIVGFGGRVMDDGEPKYLNSPETPVYNKSRTLYGLHRAKNACRTEGVVYIVEGYLDLLALHQHGIENSVATLGTALTAEHIGLLKRFAQRMVLVYDSDEAGIRSAQRCIDTFWKEHVDFRRQDVFQEENADTHILVLPQGHDPDSFLFENGAESFKAAASEAPGIISFLIERAIMKHGLSTEGKIRVVSELQIPLAAINDRVARSLYVKQLSERIGIDEQVVLEKIRNTRPSKKTERGPLQAAGNLESAPEAFNLPAQGNRLERKIITMMLQYPSILADIERQKVLLHFESQMLQSVGHKILERNLKPQAAIADLLSSTEDADQRRLMAALAMTDESWDAKGCRMLINQFIDTVQRRHQNKAMDEQIKAAEAQNDQALLYQLLKQKQKQALRNAKQKQTLLNEK
jgi:DNA primase